jgi:hypothetical protein
LIDFRFAQRLSSGKLAAVKGLPRLRGRRFMLTPQGGRDKKPPLTDDKAEAFGVQPKSTTVLLYLLYLFERSKPQNPSIYAGFTRHQRACGGAFSNCTFCTFLYSKTAKKYTKVHYVHIDKSEKLCYTVLKQTRRRAQQ